MHLASAIAIASLDETLLPMRHQIKLNWTIDCVEGQQVMSAALFTIRYLFEIVVYLDVMQNKRKDDLWYKYIECIESALNIERTPILKHWHTQTTF